MSVDRHLCRARAVGILKRACRLCLAGTGEPSKAHHKRRGRGALAECPTASPVMYTSSISMVYS